MLYVPCYQANSNGIRVLYLLGELIRELGHDVQIVAYDHRQADPSGLPKKFRPYFHRLGVDFSPQDVYDSDIVIYPDVIPDNPLGAKNIVRYLLNRPLVLTGEPVVYGPRDFVLSYSEWIDPHAFRLLLVNDDRHLFHPVPMATKESLALLYFGKKPEGHLPTDVEAFLKQFDRRTLITRWVPPNRVALGELLRAARVLVSVDPLTNLCYEATLCHTPALITNDDFNTSKSSTDLPTWGFFSRPEQYQEAVAAVGNAFPSYVEVLSGNKERVRKFVHACFDHFAMCMRTDAAGARFADLNSRYVSLQAEADRLRFEVRHHGELITATGTKAKGTPTTSPMPAAEAATPPLMYLAADLLNRVVKLAPPVHAVLKRSIMGETWARGSVPVRHQVADSISRAMKVLPALTPPRLRKVLKSI